MSIDVLANKQRPANILLVEDNYGDVILTRRAFEEAKISNQLYVAKTGEEAVSILNGDDPVLKLDCLDLILLDLNLPQMSGQAVLSNIKSSPVLRHIPVIVLSSSKAEQDVFKCYELHANSYVVKPDSLANFCDTVKKLEQFWFMLVALPDSKDVKEWRQ